MKNRIHNLSEYLSFLFFLFIKFLFLASFSFKLILPTTFSKKKIHKNMQEQNGKLDDDDDFMNVNHAENLSS